MTDASPADLSPHARRYLVGHELREAQERAERGAYEAYDRARGDDEERTRVRVDTQSRLEQEEVQALLARHGLREQELAEIAADHAQIDAIVVSRVYAPEPDQDGQAPEAG